MKYFNLVTKEVRKFDNKEVFEFENRSGHWIENDIVKNNIVISSANNYKIFNGKDELGFNKRKIVKLLELYSPVTKDIAKKIAKFYKVCPYCQSTLDEEKTVLVLDCRENFANIKKMQVDVYNEVSCCGCTYKIPFPKTYSNRAKADYIREKIESDALIIVDFNIKSLGISVMIKLYDFLSIDFSDINKNSNDKRVELKLSNVKAMQKILNDNLYLGILLNDDIVDDEDIVDIKKDIINYLEG
ncbi:hypothetical protein [Clostridium sp.]|uniref:hypothetical protein n=1 Tax=Clostridium sp. TaxID=1506 RepID=UPI001B5803E6|nr:hypothetical protein [Clostridium sp.]MBP3915924.1 hypothetical protein [Clostridium sp.]